MEAAMAIRGALTRANKARGAKDHGDMVWLVVWMTFIFPYIGNQTSSWSAISVSLYHFMQAILVIIIPTDFIFFRGSETTNQWYT